MSRIVFLGGPVSMAICILVLDLTDADYDVFHFNVIVDPGGWVLRRQFVDSAQCPTFHLKERS